MDYNLPEILKLRRFEQKEVLEALIFASEEPLSMKTIIKLLLSQDMGSDVFDIDNELADNGNCKAKQSTIENEIADQFNFNENLICELVDEINLELLETNRPFKIVDYGGGFSYSVRSEYGEFVGRLIKSKTKKRLSQASLETLAIIAYRQPVTKPEIEQIRGVNSGDIVNSLIERNFVKIVGRKDTLGKPLLYGTTYDFLKAFGLASLEELPKLRELQELADFSDDRDDIIIDASNLNMDDDVDNNVSETENEIALEPQNFIRHGDLKFDN